MIYVGVDPGLSGALVAVEEHGIVEGVLLMPRVKGSTGPLDGSRVHEWLRCWLGAHEAPRAALEAVQGRPAQGRGSLMTGARNHGLLEGLLLAGGWRYEVVAPTRWQRLMHVGTHDIDPKARSIQAARRLLPDLDLTPGRRSKPHDGLADAGLLALYALRTLR